MPGSQSEVASSVGVFGFGAPGPAADRLNEMVPSTGCPSAETIRYETV